MTAKEPLSRAELEAHLQEQMEFLERSCGAFDEGFDGEAKRIAVTIRVLLHDNKNSKSLVGQLGLIGAFVDTSTQRDPESIAAHSGLTNVAAELNNVRFIAPLDWANVPARILPFKHWWEGIVVVDARRQSFSRKDLVLTAADQDGGAHVDPSLDKKYMELSRRNSMMMSFQSSDKIAVIANPARAALRQIAHEVLKTFKPNYSKKADPVAGLVVSGITLKLDTTSKLRRNEKCHCGSGKKFKHCHGRLTRDL